MQPLYTGCTRVRAVAWEQLWSDATRAVTICRQARAASVHRWCGIYGLHRHGDPQEDYPRIRPRHRVSVGQFWIIRSTSAVHRAFQGVPAISYIPPHSAWLLDSPWAATCLFRARSPRSKKLGLCRPVAVPEGGGGKRKGGGGKGKGYGGDFQHQQHPAIPITQSLVFLAMARTPLVEKYRKGGLSAMVMISRLK